MDNQVLKQQLLSNITQMCDYAKQELAGTARIFRYEYERGFIYGHRSYHISFSYYPKTQKAEVAINFYRGNEYYFCDNKVFSSQDSDAKQPDITDDFLHNDTWYAVSYIRQAMEITQRNWPTIKEKIAKAKQEEQDIMNFKL